MTLELEDLYKFVAALSVIIGIYIVWTKRIKKETNNERDITETNNEVERLREELKRVKEELLREIMNNREEIKSLKEYYKELSERLFDALFPKRK